MIDTRSPIICLIANTLAGLEPMMSHVSQNLATIQPMVARSQLGLEHSRLVRWRAKLMDTRFTNLITMDVVRFERGRWRDVGSGPSAGLFFLCNRARFARLKGRSGSGVIIKAALF